MPEKEILKKSGICTIITLLGLSVFWFLFSIQTSFGYSGTGTTQDLKSGSRMNGDLLAQPLNGSVTIYFGTQSTQGTGTTGYIGTNTAGFPFLRYSFLGGSSSVNFNGFAAIYIDGIAIPSAGSVTNKLDAVGGVGTNNTFNNPMFAGQGTITASFEANGLIVTPPELASVNNATGELQAQLNGKQPTLINNTPGTITNVLGYTPSANTQGSITTALGYTPPANTPGSITTALGYTPPANTAGSITTALGYTPTNLGNSIALGTETTGNTDNISEGSTNKYYTDGRVNAAVGSLSVNTLSDVNIVFNENDFVKIVGGQLVAGSSTTTIAFPEVTGSATASQLPLISGLLGSATSAQLPLILVLPGTTTEQLSESNTIIYTQKSPASYRVVGTQTALLLRFNNPGSSTFTDDGDLGFSVTTTGNAIGTTSSGYLGTAGLGLYGGVNDYVSIAHNNIFNLKTNNLTLGFRFRFDVITGYNVKLLTKYQSSEDWWGIQYQPSQNQLRLVGYLPGGADFSIALAVPFVPATGTVYNIEYDRNGTTQSDHYFFINGSPQSITLVGGAWNGALEANTGPFYVGGDNRNNPPSWVNTTGMIDNVYLINGAAWHTGTYTVSNSEYTTIDTYNQNIHRIVAPDNRVLMSFVDFGTRTASDGGSTTVYMYGSTTVFNSPAPLSTSTVYAIHANGGILSNLGHYTLCFDSLKVITDDSEASLRIKYLPSFYDIKVKESYARKDNIPWLDATDRAKIKYKQDKHNAWKTANYALDKYYITGSDTSRLFQSKLFKTDYENYIEESWASDLAQNDYIQDAKDEQDMDRTRRMLRASLSESTTPAIIKAPDGSALSLDDQIAFLTLVVQEQNERLVATSQQQGSVTAEIKALKALINK